MKTSISLPDALFYAAERAAESLGMSRSELYAAALSEYMDRHAAGLTTERLNAVHGEIDSSRDQVPHGLQLRSMSREDWS